jgi:hypothetical protein
VLKTLSITVIYSLDNEISMPKQPQYNAITVDT